MQRTSNIDAKTKAKSIGGAVHPDIKKITNTRAILFAGLVAFLAQLGSFLYFLESSYTAKLASEFLSLDSTAGVCEPVTISETEVYHVDKFGTWDQATTFKYQESLFVVEFTAYEGDEASWATDMDALYSTINSEMEFLRSVSDLPLKILHLISWRKTISASKAGSILVWFDADPAYIFDIPGSQLDSNMGQTGDGCAENDAWSMKEGILTLSFEDVWVYTAPIIQKGKQIFRRLGRVLISTSRRMATTSRYWHLCVAFDAIFSNLACHRVMHYLTSFGVEFISMSL